MLIKFQVFSLTAGKHPGFIPGNDAFPIPVKAKKFTYILAPEGRAVEVVLSAKNFLYVAIGPPPRPEILAEYLISRGIGIKRNFPILFQPFNPINPGAFILYQNRVLFKPSE